MGYAFICSIVLKDFNQAIKELILNIMVKKKISQSKDKGSENNCEKP